MGTVNINNKTYSGETVNVSGSKVYVDGKLIETIQESKTLIFILRLLGIKLPMTQITISGDVNISATNSLIEVNGDITLGSVNALTGSEVTCKTLNTKGDVNCNDLRVDQLTANKIICSELNCDDLRAHSITVKGDMECDDITVQQLEVYGDLSADDINGNVNVKGDVNCDDIHGSVNAGEINADTIRTQ